MHTVGCPRQHGPRPQHIKRLAGAESRARAGARVLFAGVLRARRVPRVPAAARVPIVVVVQIVFPCGRSSPREHGFDDQIKDLFLAKVARALIRASAAASRRGTAAASTGPAAGASVTRRAAVPRTPGS